MKIVYVIKEASYLDPVEAFESRDDAEKVMSMRSIVPTSIGDDKYPVIQEMILYECTAKRGYDSLRRYPWDTMGSVPNGD